MKIVLTGGPCAGKTTISEILVKTFSPRLALIPEAASVLFGGGFPRKSEDGALRCQQRAIYHVQKELEEIYALESKDASFICDRGGLDGLAYWPGDAADFYANVGSSAEAEVARYDWVLHLDTTGTKEYRRTPMRVEDYATASRVNEKVKEAWKGHPRRIIIPHDDDFSRKIALSLEVVNAILRGDNLESVQAFLQPKR